MPYYNRTSGIHTFELQCGLCFEEYQPIRETLFQLSKETSKRFFPQNNFQKCELYSDHGLSIFLNSHLIRLIINPSRLIDTDNLIGLYAPEHCSIPFEELLCMLSSLLETFLPEEIFSRLFVRRIDYTIDSFLPSEEHVLLFLKLAKKNGLPRGFQETYPARIRNSPDFNRKFSYDVSHTSGAYHVTLYAKHQQLYTRKNIPQDMLDATMGLLRTEISCIYPQNAFPDMQPDELEYLFHSENLLSIYQDIIPKLFPYGTYLKSTLAKEMIETHYKNQRTLKKHILKYLDNNITYHSFHNGYKLLQNKNIPKKTLLETFYTIGVNPVTIAINDKVSWVPSIYTILGLDNPYKTIESNLILNLKKR